MAEKFDNACLGCFGPPMLVVRVLEAIVIGVALGVALGVCTLLYYFWRALFGGDGRDEDGPERDDD